MSFFSYLKRERYQICWSIIASGVGFGLALTADSIIANRSDRQSYSSMLSSVVAEAKSNEVVLHHSFYDHYKKGAVVNGFSLSTLRASLSSDLFIRHVERGTLSLLTEYMRNLELANGFAAASRPVSWRNPLVDLPPELLQPWTQNLEKCRDSFSKVLALAPSN